MTGRFVRLFSFQDFCSKAEYLFMLEPKTGDFYLEIFDYEHCSITRIKKSRGEPFKVSKEEMWSNAIIYRTQIPEEDVRKLAHLGFKLFPQIRLELKLETEYHPNYGIFRHQYYELKHNKGTRTEVEKYPLLPVSQQQMKAKIIFLATKLTQQYKSNNR